MLVDIPVSLAAVERKPIQHISEWAMVDRGSSRLVKLLYD